MPKVIIKGDGEVVREVELLGISRELAAAEVPYVNDLLVDVAKLIDERQAEIKAMAEDPSLKTASGSAMFLRRKTEIDMEIHRRDRGVVGYFLSKFLADGPDVPKGDLTPYERGYPVYAALIDDGWEDEVIMAIFSQILTEARKVASGSGRRVYKEVQAHLDF